MVDLSKLKNLVEWPKHRSEIEAAVLDLIRPLRRDKLDRQIKTIDEIEFRGYSRRRINYFVDPWERVSAWLFIPSGKEEVPALLCCHQQAPQGKDECAGLEGDSRLAFAQHYATLGYATLAVDCPTVSDRTSSRRPAYDTKNFYKDNPEMSLLGKMLCDHMAALDVFPELQRVDTARIGVVGHGMGGMNALLLAAFDDRVQACVSSCGFTRFATDKDLTKRWASDEGIMLLPGLTDENYEGGKLPFDWEHIIALAAPSAAFIINNLSDAELPNPKSCQKAVNLASKVYKLLGAGSAIDIFSHHDGHCVTPETLELADEWFERWL